jgi:hypothetical protein
MEIHILKPSMKELERLFDASERMDDPLVFVRRKDLLPSPEYYDVPRSPNAPKHVATSGILSPCACSRLFLYSSQQ